LNTLIRKKGVHDLYSIGLLQAKGVVPASMNSAGQATGETSNASESKSKRRHDDSPLPTISKRAKPTITMEVSPVKHEQTQAEDTSILQVMLILSFGPVVWTE
jgi:hypothetical protein